MDTQIVEVMGRNHLVNQLLRAGIEVALPVRDKGIDLIAYRDRVDHPGGYSARPIQIKAASAATFSIDRKYEQYPHLLLAYIWHLREPEKTTVYALGYRDALEVAKRMGYTKTTSWAAGHYATTRPSAKLVALLTPYRMTSSRWLGTLETF